MEMLSTREALFKQVKDLKQELELGTTGVNLETLLTDTLKQYGPGMDTNETQSALEALQVLGANALKQEKGVLLNYSFLFYARAEALSHGHPELAQPLEAWNEMLTKKHDSLVL